MRVLVIENYPKTTLGLVGAGAVGGGRRMPCLAHASRRHAAGAPDGFDALVMLGGAQDALDDANHPYLKEEAALARAFGEADKAVLGICLGAQLLARAYGAKNILGRPIEFGWHEVRADRGRPRRSGARRRSAQAAPIFHWHLDTFTLPPGAVHLATSEQTEMQAFRIGRAVLRHPVPFRGGHRARRELDARFRGGDRRLRARLAGPPAATRREARRGGGCGGARAGARLDRAHSAALLKPARAG